jgi:hypothetical protein
VSRLTVDAARVGCTGAMTRLATILALALTTALLGASSALAVAPHAAQGSGSSHDGIAIAIIAGLGLLLAGSALVPLGRRGGTHARV